MEVPLDSYKYISFPQEIFTHIKKIQPDGWIKNITAHDKDDSLLLLFFKALAFSTDTEIETRHRGLRPIREVQTPCGSCLPLFCGDLPDPKTIAKQETVRLETEVHTLITEEIFHLFSMKKGTMLPAIQNQFKKVVEEYIQKEEEKGEQELPLHIHYIDCEKLIQSYNNKKIPRDVLECMKKKGRSLAELDLSSCTLDGESLRDILECFPKLCILRLGNNSLTAQGIKATRWYVHLRCIDLTTVTQFPKGVPEALASIPYEDFRWIVFLSSGGVEELLRSGHAVKISYRFPKEMGVEEKDKRYKQLTEAFTKMSQVTIDADGICTVKCVPYQTSFKIPNAYASWSDILSRNYIHAEISAPFFELA